MADVLTTDKDLVLPFVCSRSGLVREWLDDPSCIGVLRDGILIAGVVFEAYTGTCLEMHVAGDGKRWLTKPLLRVCFKYAFIQLGCKVIRGRVPSWKPEAIRLDLKLGFKLECVLTDAAPQGSYWLMAMRKEDCRFLEI